MSTFSNKLFFAGMSLVLAAWYGQFAIASAQAVSAGGTVALAKSFGVALSGWSLVLLSSALTLLAATAALATWCMWQSAWALTASLWTCFLITLGIHRLEKGSDLRQTFYLFFLGYVGAMLTLGVRRMVNENNKSVVPTA
jgi:hypothetical protein